MEEGWTGRLDESSATLASIDRKAFLSNSNLTKQKETTKSG